MTEPAAQQKKEESQNPPSPAEPSFMTSFVSGGLAGVTGKSSIAPADRLKLIYVTSQEKFTYSGAFVKAQELIKNEGSIRALWRGNTISCARIFPYAAIVRHNLLKQFGTYDYLRRHRSSKTAFDNFLNGSMAGIVASLLVYPFEVLRTRMAMGGQFSKLSVSEMISGTIKHEGFWLGFYKGAVASVLGVVLYKGSGFMTFEFLKNHNKDRLKDFLLFLHFSSGALASVIGQFSTLFVTKLHTL